MFISSHMKNYLYQIFALLLSFSLTAKEPGSNFLEDFEKESIALHKILSSELGSIDRKLIQLENKLLRTDLDPTIKLELLFALRKIERTRDRIELRNEISLHVFRYRKGLEILKMIFEKILSLDHHFSSLASYQEIAMLSNPNSYPEFVKIKEQLKENTKLKNKVKLPDLLDNNPMFSMGYTLLYSVFGSDKKIKREDYIKRISCLLDFTLSMHSDLKIIYYETDYLKVQNRELKEACLALFDDYTDLIHYNYDLEYCRSNDDWDNIYDGLKRISDELTPSIEVSDPASVERLEKELNRIKFSIQLLMNFMDQYAVFVSSGEMYYHKFLSIIHNYQNRDNCVHDLPVQYSDLEKEILYSIDKFESAYKIAELQGSKLRDLMFGSP